MQIALIESFHVAAVQILSTSSCKADLTHRKLSALRHVQGNSREIQGRLLRELLTESHAYGAVSDFPFLQRVHGS